MHATSTLSEAAAAAVVHALPGWAALVSADGSVRAASAAWRDAFGETPLPEADGATVGAVAMGGQHVSLQRTPVRLSDGTSAWLVQATPAADADGAERYSTQLRELYRISTTAYADLDALLRDVLAVGCDVLGMPMGGVNTFRGATCRFRAITPPDAPIPLDADEPIENTLCHHVQQQGRTIVYADLGAVVGGPDHHAYRVRQVRAYVGVPLRAGRDFFGTLFFADVAAHSPIDPQAVAFAELMARHVEHAISQERAAREIQDARQLLLHAQRLAHLGSWQWNAQTGEITWSDELYRIFNLPVGSEVTFEQYVSRIHPDDRADLLARIERAAADGTNYTTQHRVVWPGGEIRHVHSVAEVSTGERGERVLTGTAQDLTERVKAQQALQESEERFRLLAENASDMICLHDPDGTYRYVSPSVKRTAGYDPEELIGRSAFDLIHPDDLQRLREEDHVALLQGSATKTLVRTRRRDGQYIWVETFVRPVFDEHGTLLHLQSSSRDVNERVLAEQALARTNQVLEQRNRELQDFAYVASHDLQEPLRKIRAFTDLLEQDNAAQLDEQGRHYLNRIDDAAARMARLISELLTFSRVTTRGQPFQRVQLADVVAEVLEDLEIAVEESGGQVVVEALPTIEADPLQMRQLFQNLIGNALKFNEPGRPVRVQVRGRVRRTAEGEVAVIEVADNGIGFDEKYLDRIFTPFQRLHNRQQYSGTGMGLAICRRIVERHQGQITAQSTAGAGATFIVSLPCTHPDLTDISTPA